ncbi:MAG TPA: phosphotransferase [Solirubrobacteraceae bacterium]|jgi:hypothetical protein|nr:phosphotransferase [Solirubrobacteraceae bacterium]
MSASRSGVSSRSADLEAALAVARDQGVVAGSPELLHEGSSVIVRLAPGGPVARVGGLTAAVRDLAQHYAREVAIAAWLHRLGAPVVAPWDPAGPFERDGRMVTFWCEAPEGPLPPGPAAGDALRRCHHALRAYDEHLPPVTFLLEEAGRVVRGLGLASDDRALIEKALRSATEAIEAASLPAQPLHGDAGMGNVLGEGLWNDWEDCCVGPIAWDLGCLVSTARILGTDRARAEAALAAYGDAPGLDSLELFVRARGAQTLAWSALTEQRGHRPRERTQRRLEWLRGQELV